MAENNNQTGLKELAEYLIEQGENNREVNLQNLLVSNDSLPVILLKDGMKVVPLEEYLPKHPARKEVARSFTEPKSFCGYINEQKSDRTRTFATFNPSQGEYQFKSIIDYHGRASEPADWCKHIVVLQLGLSDQFKTWKGINGKMLGQQEFAEFLKDNRLDIIQPSNSTIVELVEELEATVNQTFLGRTETNKGKALGFDSDVQTNRKGVKVEVPEKIVIHIPVFLGMDNFDVECDFKFRAESGRISFGIRMLAVDKLVRDTVLSAAETIRKETELPVYI